MKKLLPILLIVLGIGGGAAAGLFLKPAPEAPADGKEAAAKKTASKKTAAKKTSRIHRSKGDEKSAGSSHFWIVYRVPRIAGIRKARLEKTSQKLGIPSRNL